MCVDFKFVWGEFESTRNDVPLRTKLHSLTPRFLRLRPSSNRCIFRSRAFNFTLPLFDIALLSLQCHLIFLSARAVEKGLVRAAYPSTPLFSVSGEIPGGQEFRFWLNPVPGTTGNPVLSGYSVNVKEIMLLLWAVLAWGFLA